MFSVLSDMYGMKCRRNVEDKEENAMKMKNDFREFGCLICVRSEK